MLRPSKVAVPRPISSSTTRLREVAVCRMFAVSCISTMNVEWTRAMLSDAPTRAKRLEELELALDDPLVGAEHLLLVLLQGRGDEALAAVYRLLALVVGRDGAHVRFRDLDVVAKHAVVAHLQRGDAGPGALPFL